MKTKKFKFKQLLKLHLLKSRAYEHPIKKTNFDDLINVNLDQITLDIKKALQVIFHYDKTNKRILFIGLPSKLESKVNLLTQHAAVSKSFDVKGMISNNNVKLFAESKRLLRTSVKKNLNRLFPKLAKTPDLILLFDHENSLFVLSEASIAKIPVIMFTFSNDWKSTLSQNFYVINGNFKSILITSNENIFFIGLNFLFKNYKKKRMVSFAPKHSFSRTFTSKHGRRPRDKQI